MTFDNVRQMIKPQPDSQYRLRSCGCSSDQVVYLELSQNGKLDWVARCMDCGAQTPKCDVRHDAQIAWNHGRAVDAA